MNTNTTRNANLTDPLALLKEQTVRKLDVVAPAATLHAEAGLLRVEGTQPTFTDDGLTIGDGLYRPTEVFDEGVANKLGGSVFSAPTCTTPTSTAGSTATRETRPTRFLRPAPTNARSLFARSRATAAAWVSLAPSCPTGTR